MTKRRGNIFGSVQSPPAPAVLSRTAERQGLWETSRPFASPGAPATGKPEDTGHAGQGPAVGQELSMGHGELSALVFAGHTELVTATATFVIDTSCLNVL